MTFSDMVKKLEAVTTELKEQSCPPGPYCPEGKDVNPLNVGDEVKIAGKLFLFDVPVTIERLMERIVKAEKELEEVKEAPCFDIVLDNEEKKAFARQVIPVIAEAVESFARGHRCRGNAVWANTIDNTVNSILKKVVEDLKV